MSGEQTRANFLGPLFAVICSEGASTLTGSECTHDILWAPLVESVRALAVHVQYADPEPMMALQRLLFMALRLSGQVAAGS